MIFSWLQASGRLPGTSLRQETRRSAFRSGARWARRRCSASASGSRATIGVQRPANLTLVVIDNERYGETGMQATHTAHGVDLAAAARACGFKNSKMISAENEIQALRNLIHKGPGPNFAQVKVVAEK